MIKVTVKNHEKQKKAITQAQGSSLECSGKEWKSDNDILSDILARDITYIGCSSKEEEKINKQLSHFGWD